MYYKWIGTIGEEEIMENEKPTAAYLRECMVYVAEDKCFYWKKRPLRHFPTDKKYSAKRLQHRWNTLMTGRKAGTPYGTRGDIVIKLDSVSYKESDLLRIYVKEVAVVASKKEDPLTLRKKYLSLEKCGLKEDPKIPGVYWHKLQSKWRAQIRISGKQKHIGSYDDYDDAVYARYSMEVANPNEAGSKNSFAKRYLEGKGLLSVDDYQESVEKISVNTSPKPMKTLKKKILQEVVPVPNVGNVIMDDSAKEMFINNHSELNEKLREIQWMLLLIIFMVVIIVFR